MTDQPRTAFPCCSRCRGSGQDSRAVSAPCGLCGGSGYEPGQVPMSREEALRVYRGEP